MKHEKSCGVVLCNIRTTPRTYLLLHYPAGHWDFPKGHVEAGENELQTALRELAEETGITPAAIVPGFRETVSYVYTKSRKKCSKEVTFFLAITTTSRVTLSHEHIGFAWKTARDAHAILTFANARNVLAKAREFLHATDTKEYL